MLAARREKARHLAVKRDKVAPLDRRRDRGQRRGVVFDGDLRARARWWTHGLHQHGT
jgi:hypothetical protein